jgi:hypothetical protein
MPTFYGGGGFFSIRAGTEDIRLFEGRFEFGAVTAFNLHPASGKGSLTSGLYFSSASKQRL